MPTWMLKPRAGFQDYFPSVVGTLASGLRQKETSVGLRNQLTYFRHSRWPEGLVSYQGTASAVPREARSTTGL